MYQSQVCFPHILFSPFHILVSKILKTDLQPNPCQVLDNTSNLEHQVTNYITTLQSRSEIRIFTCLSAAIFRCISAFRISCSLLTSSSVGIFCSPIRFSVIKLLAYVLRAFCRYSCLGLGGGSAFKLYCRILLL